MYTMSLNPNTISGNLGKSKHKNTDSILKRILLLAMDYLFHME